MDCMLTYQGVTVRLLHPVSNDSLSRTNNIVNEIKEKNGVLRKCFRQDFFLYRFVFNGHITNSNRYLLTEPINR